MTDIDLGRKAITYFHNYSRTMWPATYKVSSVDALIALYGKKGEIYLDGIGLTIRVNGQSEANISTAMLQLVNQTRGKIPADHQPYIRALGGEAGKINYLDLTASVVKETATQVIEGAQAVGDQVIASGKLITWLLPFGILFFVWSHYKTILPKGKRK